MEEGMDDYFRNRGIDHIRQKAKPVPIAPQTDLEKYAAQTHNSLNNITNLLSKLLDKAELYRDYWYDESSTIDTANNTATDNPDSNVYTRIRLYEILGRTSPRVTVYNDGPGTLYVRVSHTTNTWSVTEFPLYEGEAKTYIDVYEIRMRATVAGLNYRVTEFELWKQKNVDFRAGRGYVRTQTIAVAGATPALAYLVADTHNFNALLTRNASTGYIKNTNALTDLWVWFSQDGTEYGQSGAGIAVEYTTVDPNGAINIDYMDVHSIKLGSSGLITYQIVTA